ncbi:chaperone NapD [Ramlibacter sp. G-1-2-2]|uniref:Chaperone NapD n=1 Tax=Ramlibacter agri TaxID=2728837 RepID=A0A848H857_9BURK|nr:chaperone NapD [Ramlibacter agri]NML45689.1 chaperone NapD [Ramlibacter agri]
MPITPRFIHIQPEAPEACEEWHVAGVAVHCTPARIAGVAGAVALMTGAEVHASSPEGKLVVTLEGPTARAIAAQLEVLHQLEGVLSAALVYQHGEDAASMAEEMGHELQPQGLH